MEGPVFHSSEGCQKRRPFVAAVRFFPSVEVARMMSRMCEADGADDHMQKASAPKHKEAIHSLCWVCIE